MFCSATAPPPSASPTVAHTPSAYAYHSRRSCVPAASTRRSVCLTTNTPGSPPASPDAPHGNRTSGAALQSASIPPDPVFPCSAVTAPSVSTGSGGRCSSCSAVTVSDRIRHPIPSHPSTPGGHPSCIPGTNVRRPSRTLLASVHGVVSTPGLRRNSLPLLTPSGPSSTNESPLRNGALTRTRCVHRSTSRPHICIVHTRSHSAPVPHPGVDVPVYDPTSSSATTTAPSRTTAGSLLQIDGCSSPTRGMLSSTRWSVKKGTTSSWGGRYAHVVPASDTRTRCTRSARGEVHPSTPGSAIHVRFSSYTPHSTSRSGPSSWRTLGGSAPAPPVALGFPPCSSGLSPFPASATTTSSNPSNVGPPIRTRSLPSPSSSGVLATRHSSPSAPDGHVALHCTTRPHPATRFPGLHLSQ
eukprot:Sspe_Gene.22388::Locus_8517_Transcript_1_1_Confidence_1.000_Length_1855::g.22388::m.22388